MSRYILAVEAQQDLREIRLAPPKPSKTSLELIVEGRCTVRTARRGMIHIASRRAVKVRDAIKLIVDAQADAGRSSRLHPSG